MRFRVAVAGIVLSALTGLVGCDDSHPVTPETDSSFFRATIDGAVQAEFEGSGNFWAGVDPRRPVIPTSFSLFSSGRGASANQTFLLFRPGTDRPQPGTYTLGLARADFQAHFSRTGNRGETLESYAASQGSLEITRSTPERIEGRFRMHGFRTCLRSSPSSGPVGCVAAASVIPGAPTIDVSGSFAAVPASNDVQLR